MSPHACCAALIFVGWAALCFAQSRHHYDAFGRFAGAARRRAFVVGGGFALAAAFAWLVVTDGWEFGPVRWAALLCLCALAWVLLLAANLKCARWSLLVVPICALILGAV